MGTPGRRLDVSCRRSLADFLRLGLEGGSLRLFVPQCDRSCLGGGAWAARDFSAAVAWLRQRLQSARSSRYLARSLLRLLSNDRTRIRWGDFASSGHSKIRFDPDALASMPVPPAWLNCHPRTKQITAISSRPQYDVKPNFASAQARPPEYPPSGTDSELRGPLRHRLVAEQRVQSSGARSRRWQAVDDVQAASMDAH